MILCKNGHPNEDGATYCAVCKVYIDSTAQPAPPAPTPPPPVPAPPAPAPPAPAPPAAPPAALPVVAVAPSSLSVGAGGEISCELRLQNAGAAADDYVFEIAGQAAGFATLDPAGLSLAPGTAGTARVTFRPAGTAPAAALPFQVVVHSRQLAGQSVSAEGMLIVAAPVSVPTLSAELNPRTSRGRTSAEHVVSLANPGSGPAAVTLSASDRDGFLAFEIEPPRLVLAPGAVGSAEVRLRGRKRSLFRGERSRPFQLLVAPEGKPSFTLDGTFVQQRYVPLILMPFASLLLVILVIAALLVILVAFLLIKYVVLR